MPYKSPSDFYSWLRFRVPPLKKKNWNNGFFFCVSNCNRNGNSHWTWRSLRDFSISCSTHFYSDLFGKRSNVEWGQHSCRHGSPREYSREFFLFFLLKTGSRLLGVGFAFTTEDLLAPSKAFYHFSFHVYTKKHACMNRQISTQNIRAIHNAPYLANSKDGHLSCSTHLQQQRGHRPPAPSRILLLDTYIFECVLAEIRSNESDWKPK